MAFSIPNEADASNANQAELDKVDIDALIQAFNGEGVISGCAVTQRGAGANMSVDVAVGQVKVGGYFPFTDSTATQNKTISAADGTNPRFDIVSVDYNGAITVTAGTPAANPVFPAIPSNSVILAAVYVPASDTSIETAQIIDKRVFVPNVFQLSSDFLPGSTTTFQIGGLNWAKNGAGTEVLSQQAGTASHPGVLRIGTGTTSGNDAQIYPGAAATTGVFLPADIARVRGIVNITTITTVAAKFGIGQDLGAEGAAVFGTAGAWIEFAPASDASWRCYTRQASTSSTALDTAVDVSAGNWYQLDIVRTQDATWQFAVNGALKGEITSNVPTTACNVGFCIGTITTATRTMDIDFFGMDFKPLGNRWT